MILSSKICQSSVLDFLAKIPHLDLQIKKYAIERDKRKSDVRGVKWGWEGQEGTIIRAGNKVESYTRTTVRHFDEKERMDVD